MLVVWLEKNLAECTSACVCVSVCVRAHHTSSHLVDDEKREDPPLFECFDMFMLLRPVDGFLFAFFMQSC